MSNTKVFFHSADHDGCCSAAIVKMMSPHAELYPINYGEAFPWDVIDKGDVVYMVDFSLEPFSDMVRLDKMCNLIWIDHHISAIENSILSNTHISGKRSVEASGCMLTWNFCYPERVMPRAVSLLGRYDIFSLEKDVLEFEYAMRAKDTNPNNQAFWTNLFHDNGVDIDELIADGVIIREYVERTDGKAVKSTYEFEFEGITALVINRGTTNSLFFEQAPNIEKYKMLIAYSYDGKMYNVSLYSKHPSVDVSKIAVSYGGGGHKKASGFSTDKNIFARG